MIVLHHGDRLEVCTEWDGEVAWAISYRSSSSPNTWCHRGGTIWEKGTHCDITTPIDNELWTITNIALHVTDKTNPNGNVVAVQQVQSGWANSAHLFNLPSAESNSPNVFIPKIDRKERVHVYMQDHLGPGDILEYVEERWKHIDVFGNSVAPNEMREEIPAETLELMSKLPVEEQARVRRAMQKLRRWAPPHTITVGINPGNIRVAMDNATDVMEKMGKAVAQAAVATHKLGDVFSRF